MFKMAGRDIPLAMRSEPFLNFVKSSSSSRSPTSSAESSKPQMSPTDLLDYVESGSQSPAHARTSPFLDLSQDSNDEMKEDLECSRRLQLSFENEPEIEFNKQSTTGLDFVKQLMGESPKSSIHTFRSTERQPEANYKEKPSPNFSKPPVKSEERTETSKVLDFHQVSMGAEESSLNFGPDAPAWLKINNLLRRHGFRPIAIKHDENLVAVPDFASLADTLIEILNKYQTRGTQLQEAITSNSSQRQANELSYCRQENERLFAENAKLKGELETERQIKREDCNKFQQKLTESDKHNRVLRSKLESTKQICTQRDLQINELKAQLNMKHSKKSNDIMKTIGPQRELEIFRQFFNREYRHTSDQDTKIMGMILMYEEQLQQKTPEVVQDKKLESAYQELEQRFHEALAQLDRLRRERSMLEGRGSAVNEEINQLRAELRERPTVREYKTLQEQVKLLEERAGVPADKVAELSGEQARKIVFSISEMLSIKNTQNLMPSIDKMQRVVRAVPKLEQFIKGICSEVFTNDQPDFGASKMDQVLPTIKRWKLQLELLDSLKSFRTQILAYAGLEATPDVPDFDIIRALKKPSQDENPIVKHLQSLFDIEREGDILGVVNQIYLFVVEMKGLVKYLRETLRLDPRTPVTVVVQRLKQALD